MSMESGWHWSKDLRRDIYLGAETERGTSIPLEPLPRSPLRRWLLDEPNRERQQQHLSRYLGANYSGKLFEWFIAQSSPTRFTPWDILAAESLSVPVPSASAQWLLKPNDERDGLLDEAIERGAGSSTLWTCDEALIADDGPLSQLYRLLRNRQAGSLGRVTASKVLAAKFPSVVPIRDSRVEALLEMEGSSTWWMPIRELFLGEGGRLAAHLDQLRLPDGVGTVSTLRRLDVVLWMEARARRMGEPAVLDRSQ